ncbi:hypothetical protein A2Z67_04050 [Candidatus Woesebacteria bacterium RBG_13_36_22]|uniref:Uncharacterized protein n=1 Tax=Candidatus Woesebacteria bacterium RBG_13_36_22 TaxID=1802478 RepID=A0A1F7X5T4_9BACT|nr:MAG: hypothetical protein A2Z67_04050 [Candidatus Woesebacteria bacterium RBG_13_36_22]
MKEIDRQMNEQELEVVALREVIKATQLVLADPEKGIIEVIDWIKNWAAILPASWKPVFERCENLIGIVEKEKERLAIKKENES